MKTQHYFDNFGSTEAAGTTHFFTITRQRLNGLTILLDQTAAPIGTNTGYITVVRRTKDRTVMLCSRLNMYLPKFYHDYKRGKSTFVDVTKYAFFLPLGYLDLNDSTLEVTVETGIIYQIISIGTYLETIGVDNMLIHQVSNDNSINIPDCEFLAEYNTTPYSNNSDTPGTCAVPLAVQLTDHADTILTNTNDLLSSTMAASATQAPTATDVLVIFENDDDIPDNIGLLITGTAAQVASNLIYYIMRQHDLNLVNQSTRNNATITANKLSKIEHSDPAKAQALRHAGKTVKSIEIHQALQTAKG
jgi:hypothetical protein